MKYTPGQEISATYRTAVYKPRIGGWRQETVNARLEVISPGKARVIIANVGGATSRRQEFNTSGIAAREEGKVKIISKLTNVETI